MIDPLAVAIDELRKVNERQDRELWALRQILERVVDTLAERIDVEGLGDYDKNPEIP